MEQIRVDCGLKNGNVLLSSIYISPWDLIVDDKAIEDK